MKEFKVLLFIMEKDFSQSQTIELYLRSQSEDTLKQYLADTIKKEYRITQIEHVRVK